jgi:hypothetical protein
VDLRGIGSSWSDSTWGRFERVLLAGEDKSDRGVEIGVASFLEVLQRKGLRVDNETDAHQHQARGLMMDNSTDAPQHQNR